MVSGVDTPMPQNPLIEASTNVALINQARQGAIVNSSALVVGKQFQAEVVAKLTDGTYIVKVADIAARMQLPNSPEVGNKLSLTLLSTSPRATFLLNPPGAQQQGSAPTTTNATLGTSVKQLIDEFNHTATGNTAGHAVTPGSGATSGPASNAASGTGATNVTTAITSGDNNQPRLINISTPVPDSAPATFSTAGKLVNQLIQNTPQQASVVNVSKVPLMATPDVSINTMVKALQGGVANSGVFYESHLLQWAEGTRPTAELMKEPQSQFPVPVQNAPQNAGAPQPEADKAALPQNLAGTASALSNSATSSSSSSATAATITLPKDAPPLIQQQLQTMEQQRFVWHGELWPGQTMDWEIARNDQNQNQAQRDSEPTWHSAVSFELPQLGSVSAQLQLTGNHLRLSINTKDGATALLLKNHGPELTNALEAAGTQLDALLIKTNTAS